MRCAKIVFPRRSIDLPERLRGSHLRFVQAEATAIEQLACKGFPRSRTTGSAARAGEDLHVGR
jgi:predicted RNA binding protein YcfA (HicA-like mRNA interferase family)